MPQSLPNREAHPVVLEQATRVGEFIQEGFGGQVDFYNLFTTAILPGEPLIYMGRLGISKYVVLSSELGQMHFGAWMNFLADPNLAANILAGQKVYYDIGLADSNSPGYATQVQPANGYFLGYATCMHEKTAMQLDTVTGKPIACTTSQARVGVLMHQDKMVLNRNYWGTPPDVANGDTSVISS